MSWQSIKQELKKHSDQKLVSLIGELYKLDKNNQRFLLARFSSEETNAVLQDYKDIISKSVCPNPPKVLRLSVAKKAVNDFKKANDNVTHTIDLMIYYVEKGVEFTAMYGDINESFYCSLESMFETAIELIQKKESLVAHFLPRLKKIVFETSDMGWGFHDYLSDVFHDAFKNQVINHNE